MDKAHRRAFIQISPGTGIALQQDENKGNKALAGQPDGLVYIKNNTKLRRRFKWN
jgi:hypothetical protein